MAEGLKKKLHIKNGNRGHVSRLITEFSRTNEQVLLNLKRREKSLQEKVKVCKNFDDEILELKWGWNFNNEIDKSYQFSDEINDMLEKIECVFSKNNVENSSVHTNSTTNSSVSSNPNGPHSKLPKLILGKFNEDVLSWQSFWDQ